MNPYLPLIQKVLAEGSHIILCDSTKQAYRIKHRFYQVRKELLTSDPTLGAEAAGIMVSLRLGTFPCVEFALRAVVDDAKVEESLLNSAPRPSADPEALLSKFLREAEGNLSTKD